MPQELLDEEDLQAIDNALEEVDELQEQLDRAEQAGLDVSQMRERATQARTRLRSIRQAFFPGRT